MEGQRLLVDVDEVPDGDRRYTESMLGPATSHYGTLRGTYPEENPQSSNSTNTVRSTKRYRLAFLIVISFDTTLLVFLSILCALATNLSLKGYFTELHIRISVFDIVLMSIIRFVFLFLFYLVLGWVTRIVLIVTTLASTIYIPVKAYFYWGHLPDNNDLTYLLVIIYLFAAFVLPWLTTFFFEFKFLPAEVSRLSSTSWTNWKAWCCPWMLVKPLLPRSSEHETGGNGPVDVRSPTRLTRYNSIDTVFRTPLDSTRCSPIAPDNEELSPIREEETHSPELPPPAECDQLSNENEQYKIMANEAVERLETLARTNTGWTLEKHQDGIKCYSYLDEGDTNKKWKSEMTLNMTVDTLWRALYHEGHRTPEWNTNVAVNEVVYRIDRTTDIVYTATKAVVMVSARDFVSVRKASVRGGCYYCASVSVTFGGRPPVPDKIRGENRPSGYVLVPVDSSRTLFIWVVDSDMKGWIPQSVIDQTLSGTLLTANNNLQTFLQNIS